MRSGGVLQTAVVELRARAGVAISKAASGGAAGRAKTHE